MKSKPKTELTASAESLKESIRKYDRPSVLMLLQQDTLELISKEEQTEIIRQIVGLRDMSLIDALSKKLEFFSVEMMEIDTNNHLNTIFLNQLLNKYNKKFDLSDKKIFQSLFAFSCKIGNTKTASILLKKAPEQDYYIALASSASDTFDLLLQINPAKLDSDTQTNILYQAALCSNGQDRLTSLIKAGYSLDTKDNSGKTVLTLLENRISSSPYPSNKNGVQMRQMDKSTLLFLNHTLKDSDTSVKKRNMIIGCTAGGVIVLAAIIAFAIWYTGRSSSADTSTDTSTESTAEDATASDNTTADTSTEDTSSSSYSTDTSLAVADGDTVNIDYTGYVDGTTFSGGSTNGAGADLVIGSGSYIDDFEDQLIGAAVGSQVEVNVTFPDNYSNTDLAGKDATFDVTINGIYE